MSRAFEGKARPTTRSVARRAVLRGCSIVNITEGVRKSAADSSGARKISRRLTRRASRTASQQAISEEEALKKGMEEPSAANRSAAEIAEGKWTIRRIAREGEAQRSQKSKDSSRREASEKTFAQQKAAGRGSWPQPSQFVEKGAEVYAKA